jgi:segregation and condensation protein A
VGARSPLAGAGVNVETGTTAYRVTLPEFEGPLDLLLHLCKTHEIEVVNLPIAFITTKYLEYLEIMQTMPVDVAADYLVMAATLAYLKSRELVPSPEPLEVAQLGDGEDDVIDPREELIRRLLEYQKYKDAAEKLGGRPIEGRNVFGRGATVEVDVDVATGRVADESVWKLIEAFGRILEKVGPASSHDVVVDRVSIGDRINQLVDKLEGGGGSFRFDSCFDLALPEPELRNQVVVTLLAILELARLRLVRVLQSDEHETLYVTHVEGTDLSVARRAEITSAQEDLQDGLQEDLQEGSDGKMREDMPVATGEDADAAGLDPEDTTDAGTFDETTADSTLVEHAPAGADDAARLQERGEE